MTCSVLRMPTGPVIVCSRHRIKRCVVCGAPATRECDWRMRKRYPRNVQAATCDRGLCDEHTYSPAAEKDLCPEHRKAWAVHPGNSQADLAL